MVLQELGDKLTGALRKLQYTTVRACVARVGGTRVLDDDGVESWETHVLCWWQDRGRSVQSIDRLTP
jgi:hypothetical protein